MEGGWLIADEMYGLHAKERRRRSHSTYADEEEEEEADEDGLITPFFPFEIH